MPHADADAALANQVAIGEVIDDDNGAVETTGCALRRRERDRVADAKQRERKLLQALLGHRSGQRAGEKLRRRSDSVGSEEIIDECSAQRRVGLKRGELREVEVVSRPQAAKNRLAKPGAD